MSVDFTQLQVTKGVRTRENILSCETSFQSIPSLLIFTIQKKGEEFHPEVAFANVLAFL